MNTVSKNIRVNLTIPTDVIMYLKRHSKNMSEFFSIAARSQIAREKREKALKEILEAKPVFADVKDGTTYVHEIRSIDKKCDERLNLL